VVDLATGLPLPLGQDAAGKPVYLIHSDARGHYEVYLPAGVSTNVRVVTGMPGQTDARLLYNLVTSPRQDGDVPFDEASALVSDYVRRAVTEQMLRMTFGKDADATLGASLELLPPQALPLLKPASDKYLRICAEEKVGELSQGRIRRVTRAWSDALVARVDLSEVMSPPAFTKLEAPSEKAMPALVKIVREVLAKTAGPLNADPAAYDQAPWLLSANFRRAEQGLPAAVIRKPADVGRVIMEEFAGSELSEQARTIWVPLVDLGFAPEEGEHMRALITSVYLGLLLALFTDETLRDDLGEALRRAARAERGPDALPEPPGEAAATAPFELPAEATRYDVKTLVGNGNAGHADGPGNTATVDAVRSLVWDGADTLYFSDNTENRFAGIRKVDLRDPTHPVTTIAGGKTGKQDGTPEAARFAGVEGLALEKTATATTIYLGDGWQSLRKLVLPADGSPGSVITLYAGANPRLDAIPALALDGKGGLLFIHADSGLRRLDLTAASPAPTSLDLAPLAALGVGGSIFGMARATDNQIYLADYTEDRIWRLKPNGGLAFVAGATGAKDAVDGYGYGAAFSAPTGLAAAPDGSLLVAESAGHVIRRVRIRPDGLGVVTTLTGSGATQPAGFLDGPAEHARFNMPAALCAGPNGSIFVADRKNNRIRVLEPRP
jgi:hypothetical protein